MGPGREARFDKYCDTIVHTLMHADREQPARWYIKGLMLPGERKSVGPMQRHEPTSIATCRFRLARAIPEHCCSVPVAGAKERDKVINTVVLIELEKCHREMLFTEATR